MCTREHARASTPGWTPRKEKKGNSKFNENLKVIYTCSETILILVLLLL